MAGKGGNKEGLVVEGGKSGFLKNRSKIGRSQKESQHSEIL